MINEEIKEIEDISTLERINQGNTAEVYLYSEDKVLKLFREGMPQKIILVEYKKAQMIQSVLTNVCKVFGMVSYQSRYGIIYERIDGVDLIKEMLGNIGKISFYARLLADLHLEIHQKQVDVQEGVKEKLERDIDLVQVLSESEKTKIKAYLQKLPEGRQLCHFDFHPGNVMMQKGSPMIIDWMTACTGNPNADVARTYLLLQFGELPHASFWVRQLVLAVEKHIGSVYYKEYIQKSGVTRQEVEQWLLPVAAARLVEWIPESEKKKLLDLVKKQLAVI